MLRLTSLKLNINHSFDDLINAVSKKLHLKPCEIKDIKIIKKSLDARDKNNIRWIYTADVRVNDEKAVLKASKGRGNISRAEYNTYKLPGRGSIPLGMRPYIAGSGPAGLFCAYFLAEYGYRPVLIERGEPVLMRQKTVRRFFDEGILDPESNIQFGEGGAGTFSDGKLNTRIKDRSGRITEVLETFVRHGAPEEILFSNRPHIGTDVLSGVIINMREHIISCGGEVRFGTRLTGFSAPDGCLSSITLEDADGIYTRPCGVLVLAVGHSARDTLYMLKDKGVNMQAKGFAVGVRAEHLQEDINRAMYGEKYKEKYGSLPNSDYKLACRAGDGRGVYSFCMCPGGYVVNSSSEEGRLCVNGMSFSHRDGKNANSAIVVTVSAQDTGADKDPMAGIEFQRDLERRAYIAASGRIPVQRLDDFMLKKCTKSFGDISPQSMGKTGFADLNSILPGFICEDIKEAFRIFGGKISGFDRADTVLSAAESRTSSPVRIVRDENFESSIKGIFPAGEGAGYSGGITSSAVDGIKIFEEIYSRYSPPET